MRHKRTEHPENLPKSKLPSAPWSLCGAKIAEQLSVAMASGLAVEEVRKRRKTYGPNRLREKKRASAWRIFVDQFKSLIIAILGGAAIAAFLFGKWLEGIAVGIALVINAVIGFFTELKATRSMEALQRLGGVRTRVRRDGRTRDVKSRDLVPGDLVLIEAGDIIPADLRLLEANNLQADESALTGESLPVQKDTNPVEEDAELAGRTGMLFKGTSVTSGSGLGVVTATGMATEIGTIASLTQEAGEEATPLEKRLERLGRRLIALTFLMGIIVAVAGVLGGKDWVLVLETAIAMAVAAVPEGLPVVATMALARGMWRMAARNALISRLSAVETLGATTVICTDKTGTLTENRMRVQFFALPDAEMTLTENGTFFRDEEEVDPGSNEPLRRALEIGALCNNADLETEKEIGDPMETALLRAARSAGMEREELLKKWPKEREEPFSTATKMMTTVHQVEGGFRVAVKGAPEAVLQACRKVAGTEGEQELDREAWLERNQQLAERGLRLLALAEKSVDSANAEPYDALTLVGLVGLLDPPRREVGDALEECRRAGIRVIMVTGDQPATALGIAAAIGLESDAEKALRGEVLRAPEEFSAEERRRILAAAIFARVTPEQKLALITLHQEAGDIVAMTGDGVNDAPALKKADIGVAMGQRGTEVAKEAADMILKDDRFATIVEAVRYGRGIFNNIRKFIFYLISGNLSEVLIITVASVLGLPLPLLPLQILYINLVGDIFPALALGLGEGTPGIMERPPRDPREPILTRGHWLGIGGYSLVFTFSVLGTFAFALRELALPSEVAVTVSFCALVLARLWHVFNMRDPGTNLFRNEVTTNPYVWGALGIGLGLLAIAIYVPVISAVLNLRPPFLREWLLIAGGSLPPLLVGQAVKLRGRHTGGRPSQPLSAPSPLPGESSPP